MTRGNAEKPADWGCGRHSGSTQRVGAMRRSGSVMRRGAVQFFVLGEPSALDGTALAAFLFPAARAE
jgi:hypothetical protein